jgi:hypothetical protein
MILRVLVLGAGMAAHSSMRIIMRITVRRNTGQRQGGATRSRRTTQRRHPAESGYGSKAQRRNAAWPRPEGARDRRVTLFVLTTTPSSKGGVLEASW